MTTEKTVVTSRDGRVGRILLNRPRALNALELPMLRACAAILETWRNDPHIHAVVIEGCRCIAPSAPAVTSARCGMHSLSGDRASADQFFSEEYALNLAIATYPKPYIALIDGICMGGGIGLSVHAPYRVASEHAAFAMPETAIGFFPDIGATFLLPRLPGELGSLSRPDRPEGDRRRCGSCRFRDPFYPARPVAGAVCRAGQGRGRCPRRLR